MEQGKDPEVEEFYHLITAIRTESDLLKKIILSDGTEKEENEILSELDRTVQAQTFSILNNLIIYRSRGWRALIDG